MPAVSRRKQALIVACATATSLLLLSGQAQADEDGSWGTGTSGNADENGTISAAAGGVTYDRSENGSGSSAGPVAPAGNWTPPACWYAPKYTPKQLKKEREATWSAGSTGYEWDQEQREHYAEGKPYKDFNMKKSGKGYWWDSYVNESFPTGWDSCKRPPFWVDKGDPPPDVPDVVTPEILAELAYAEIRVPDTDIDMAPANAHKVNLPTWAWLDKAEFKPVSVTASVPVLDIKATTTATPVSMRIEPGTKDAELHPGSGECPIGKDGSIGTPYKKGNADKTPPCGLTYLRASGDNPYELKATITWKIDWEGSGGAGGDLPNGTFGNTQDVTVQEVQTHN